MKTTENGFGSRARFSINICTYDIFYMYIAIMSTESVAQTAFYPRRNEKKNKKHILITYDTRTHTHTHKIVHTYSYISRAVDRLNCLYLPPVVCTHTNSRPIARRPQNDFSILLPLRFPHRIPSTDSRGQTL